jgi:hypothetical protein
MDRRHAFGAKANLSEQKQCPCTVEPCLPRYANVARHVFRGAAGLQQDDNVSDGEWTRERDGRNGLQVFCRTYAGFNVHRAQTPRRVEQKRHVGRQEAFGWVVPPAVGRCLHKLKVFQLHFQLFFSLGSLRNDVSNVAQ